MPTAPRNGLGNVVDPLINLATLNYILAGVQVSLGQSDGPVGNDQHNLWWELLHRYSSCACVAAWTWRDACVCGSMDPSRFHKDRHYTRGMKQMEIGMHWTSVLEYPENQPLTLDDLLHLVHMCMRPLGIVRASEKQGGQSETTLSPVSWPAPAMVTLTLDGKEDHVVNIWHKRSFNSGDDLVLRMKPMPLKQYAPSPRS